MMSFFSILNTQQQFLTSYIEQSTDDSVDYNYKLLKATVVFGAIYLAKYAMRSDNSEHPMAVSLLKNLEGNLSILDNQYHIRKGLDPIQIYSGGD